MTKRKLIIYTDGGSRGNPGQAGVGVVIYDEKKNILGEFCKHIGIRTNNEAEYEAVILALEKVKQFYLPNRTSGSKRFGSGEEKEKMKELEIEFRIDSQLIARQLGGKYKIKEERLFVLCMKARNLLVDIGSVTYTEIPREQNKEADRLANKAMDGEK